MKKNKLNKNAFTLIELMVVMTIMIILTMTMYTSFAHYQKKQKVRNSAKIITQVLNDARSQAIY
jgi:prepilin-type N-terminal cleavage/methylation domain-containing protein